MTELISSYRTPTEALIIPIQAQLIRIWNIAKFLFVELKFCTSPPERLSSVGPRVPGRWERVFSQLSATNQILIGYPKFPPGLQNLPPSVLAPCEGPACRLPVTLAPTETPKRPKMTAEFLAKFGLQRSRHGVEFTPEEMARRRVIQ